MNRHEFDRMKFKGKIVTLYYFIFFYEMNE